MSRLEKVISPKATPHRLYLSGQLIAESFPDGNMAEGVHLDYFLQCLMDDDALLRPESADYRITLSSSVYISLMPYAVIF